MTRRYTGSEIVAGASILDVARALGATLKRNRCIAPWRPNADTFNISLDASKNAFFDFVAGRGGGLLDFIEQARGCTRKEALIWLAEYTGRPIEEQTDSERIMRAKRLERLTGEARRIVQWREALLSHARQRRDTYLYAHHRCVQHILHCRIAGNCCAFAMDADEASEERFQQLDRHIDALTSAPWEHIVAVYREQTDRHQGTR